MRAPLHMAAYVRGALCFWMAQAYGAAMLATAGRVPLSMQGGLPSMQGGSQPVSMQGDILSAGSSLLRLSVVACQLAVAWHGCRGGYIAAGAAAA